jgi:hypothetical protein
VAQAKECPCCGTVPEGELPAGVRARASFGPEAHAQEANLVLGHHVPVYRATLRCASWPGSRSSRGGVLPGYAGIIVRDGYGGYVHLTDALHAWCGVHLLRDLKDLYDFAVTQSYLSTAAK